jgi:integrase
MPLFRKAGTPFYWYDFRVAGVRHRGSTKQTSVTVARQIEAALIHQLNSGDATQVRKKAPQLREAALTFLEYVQQHDSLADATKEYYRYGWKMLSSLPIAQMRIDSITKSDTQTLGISGSGSKVNCALRTLRRILSLAEEKNLIIKMPKIPLVEEVERTQLIEADIEDIILAKAPETLRDAYLLIADCGIRPGDCVAIGWEHDVDFVRRTIWIAGGKTGKKAQRTVQMSSRVFEMLKRRAGLDPVWAFASVKKSREGKPMTAHGIIARFSAFKRQQGFPKAVVLYCARHTFATDITKATGNITETQKTLGHTSLKTTARYVHANVAQTGAVMDARNAERHNLGHSALSVQ